MGRSGTTSIYDAVATHPDTVWLCELESRFDVVLPQRIKAANLRRPGARATRWRHALSPSEAYGWWDRYWPEPGDNGRVIGQRIAAMQHGRLFVNKNTRNTRRMRELGRILPHASHVLVVRHPAAVCSSLVRVAWWPELELWTRSGARPRELATTRPEHLALAAELWSAEMASALAAHEDLDPLVVRYEDFVDEPGRWLTAIWRHAGLTPDSEALELASRRVHSSSRERWRTELSDRERSQIAAATIGTASGFGYELS